MATKKVVTFIKQYFFMLALAATFVGFSAFKFTEVKQATVWFETNDAGEILDVTNGQSSSPNGCAAATTLRHCALGFNPADLEGGTDAPISGVSDDDESMYTYDIEYRQN